MPMLCWASSRLSYHSSFAFFSWPWFKLVSIILSWEVKLISIAPFNAETVQQFVICIRQINASYQPRLCKWATVHLICMKCFKRMWILLKELADELCSNHSVKTPEWDYTWGKRLMLSLKQWVCPPEPAVGVLFFLVNLSDRKESNPMTLHKIIN